MHIVPSERAKREFRLHIVHTAYSLPVNYDTIQNNHKLKYVFEIYLNYLILKYEN